MSTANRTPQVSVIIPAYNGDRYIVQAVESSLSQTFTDLEIIVVDDGSTDGTHQVLHPYLDRIRYIYQENQGVAAARNRGIKEAQGEFLAFLDADDYFLPSKLEKQLACFDVDPALDMVQTGWFIVNEKGQNISAVKPWEQAPKLDLESFILYKCVRPSAMLLRRKWWKKLGGFDSQFPLAEDLDFALRLTLKGGKAAWLEEILTCYRQHNSSLMSSGFPLMKNTEIMMEKFFARPDLPKSILRLKKQERYQCFVWMAWRMYRDGHIAEMAECLEKSLQYTPFSSTETVLNWLQTFKMASEEYGNNFDGYSLSQLREWQDIILMVMTNPPQSQQSSISTPPKAREAKLSRRKSHILLYNTDDPGVGGVAQYNHAILCQLALLGYRVTCVQTKHSSPLVERERELGIDHLWLDFSSYKDLSRVLRNTQDAQEIFSSNKPDLIIFSDGWPYSNFAAKQVVIEMGIPYMMVIGLVMPEHAIFAYGDVVPYREGVLYQCLQARALIVGAYEHLNLLCDGFDLPKNKGQVIYLGRSPEYFAPPNAVARQRLRQEIEIPEDAIVCFTSARLTPIKGHRYQIEAIKQLKQSPVWSKLYFVWAGTGEGSSCDVEIELRETIRKLGVSDRVKLIGQRWDIIDWLDASDIFILTSLADAAPSFAVMEAMAKGLPVVASAAGGIPEGLGDAGKLLPDPNTDPEGTARELAKTVEAWAMNPELRHQIGQACKQRAEKLFKEERMLAESIEAIEKALVCDRERDQFVTQKEVQTWMTKVENRVRYSFLVWKAWQAYCQEDLIGMQQWLQESLKCTPFLSTETLLHWVESFCSFSLEKGSQFDTYSLSNSAEWQQLVYDLQGLESVFCVR
ncbi:MAG TPA: glycosyl transferase [Microcoleaceae bacterium UBA10368]|jgi:Glycosyltransferase|nr:glycosyl transferase [Microcoleaceae cyanobacterium UBA11344]HBK96402.1 glycosyl transferase [Microcoleaceae cyanobacterium UBA10368]HCV30620.1 glycosyl transferase [Microcoleaceae cyanobacterium UBA9251]